MAGAIASFTAMAISGREIQLVLDSFELMFWRSLVGFIVIGAIVLWQARKLASVYSVIRMAQPGLHLWRNVFHFTGQNLWFYGLTAIPLAQLIALEFTSPIWVALLAPLILREKLTRKTLLAVLTGFVGVLLVAQPGVHPLGPGHAAGLFCAIAFAMNLLLTKLILRHDSVLCILFWMTLLQMLFGLALAQLGGFTWPPLTLAPWLLVVGLAGLSAHLCLSSALGHAPATTVAPLEFLRLPILALVGAWLYAEGFDLMVLAGAAVIFLANWMNLRPRRTVA